jgi:DeoR/GlpR family transcriptional regulator of sugar metabolism
LNTKRIWEINSYIQQKGEVHLSELVALFPDFSAMTIRRDIDYLEQQGFVVRTRGGAKSISHLTRLKEDVFVKRELENRGAKEIIAKKALSFLEGGRSFFLDSGTTLLNLAALVPENCGVLITAGPNIAVELCRHGQQNVSVLGGSVNTENLSISGASALEQLRNVNIDVAFMATSGFTIEAGFSVGNINEAQLKRLVITRAQRVVMLMDHSKLENRLPYSFANFVDVNALITEDLPPPKIIEAARQAGTELI